MCCRVSVRAPYKPHIPNMFRATRRTPTMPTHYSDKIPNFATFYDAMVQELLNISLKGRNSFGVNATADRIVEFDDDASLLEYLTVHKAENRGRLAVLGGGNNILFTGDFHGTLLHPTGGKIAVTAENGDLVSVRADAGVDWDTFVGWCESHGLWGAENLTAIPGTVGAAPVQNIGAYGTEAKDIIDSIELLDLETLKPATISGCHCGFGYRDSIFKGTLKGRTVITAVHFRLSRTPQPRLGYAALEDKVAELGGPTLTNIRTAVRAIRDGKLPDPAVTGNAGSFFKNPVVESATAARIAAEYTDMPSFPAGEGKIKIPAGWLIEKAGWKGHSRGKAGVYERQALVLVNLGGATGTDITSLAEEVIADVERKFGIRIETEVNIW